MPHLTAVDQIQWFSDLVLRGDVPETARFFQTAPGTSHIHWLVGHVAFAIDKIAMSALEGRSTMPDSLLPTFGWGSKPVPDPAAYPSWEETLGHLRDAIERLRSHVAGLDEDDLARPLPEGHPFAKRIPNRAGVISFIALHTGYHLGQVSLLRRAQGLPSGLAG